MEITSSFSNMRPYPNKSSNIISQVLFGEEVEVISEEDQWIYCTNLIDNYKGWLNKETLGIPSKKTHFIKQIRTAVLEKPDVKSNLIKFISIRSQVNVDQINGNWAKIELKDNRNQGYINLNSLFDKLSTEVNPLYFAKKFLGIPYRWGGRDSSGIDCSALIRLSLSFTGDFLPRDTIDQYQYFKNSKHFKIIEDLNPMNNISSNDLIYWPGHIAMFADEDNMIHASAYHGGVVIEKKEMALNRIKKKPIIIKNLNS